MKMRRLIMDNKLLSQECVDYCNLLENLSTTEDKIRNKLLDIIQLYDHHAYLIDSYFIYNEEFLTVNYMASYLGDSDNETYLVRIKWLDLDRSEIKKLIEAEEEERRKQAEIRKQEELERYKKELEEKERQEYKRLKAKFETKDNNEK
jgi:Zn-finger nucleic acid-binding protein